MRQLALGAISGRLPRGILLAPAHRSHTRRIDSDCIGGRNRGLLGGDPFETPPEALVQALVRGISRTRAREMPVLRKANLSIPRTASRPAHFRF